MYELVSHNKDFVLSLPERQQKVLKHELKISGLGFERTTLAIMCIRLVILL